jgi:hypothetical protein
MSFWDELHSAIGSSQSAPEPPPQPPYIYVAPGPSGPPYAYLSPDPVGSSPPQPPTGTLPGMQPMPPPPSGTLPGMQPMPPPPAGNSGAAADAAKEDQLRLQADQDVLRGLNGNSQDLAASIAAAKAATTKEFQDLEPKYDAAWNAVSKPQSITSLKKNLSQLGNVISRLQDIWTQQHDLSLQARDAAEQLVQQYDNAAPGAQPEPPPQTPASLLPFLDDPRGRLLEGNASEYGTLLDGG